MRVAYVPKNTGLKNYRGPGKPYFTRSGRPDSEGGRGRDILPESLKALGADVWDVPAYKTVLGGADREELKRLLGEKAVDAVTFTSSSTVRNFMQLLDGDTALLDKVKVFSIGPITSATARELGLKVYMEAAQYTINGLVEALKEGLG